MWHSNAMFTLDLYIFLVFTFGHFASIPLWLKRFAGGEFSSLEEYLFYASFFAVGSFYVVLHIIGLSSTAHLYPMAHNLLGGWLLHGLHSPLVID